VHARDNIAPASGITV